MKKFKTVGEYIKSAPEEVQPKLNEIRKLITTIAPEAEEKISYGMPYYGYKGRLIYFAYFKNHIGIYVMNGVMDDFKDEVENYKSGRATLRFGLDKRLPLALIKKLVTATKIKNEKKS